MAKVPLRAYVREIKELIEKEHLGEAIAHCLHILKTFPMYVDAYRLLGEALLEMHRYADAADIFQRILAAVPDDFIAHLGMSIARESENRLDEAIWHMECAFEMQPSNPAVQAELRRLYGRRDGVEPLKIRLNREALANMYLQGELYNQAIAELRSLLSEDPQRPDLQVMLARAYFRAGRKAEALESCAELLKKYPYCLDALRIMSDLLPGTSHAENVQVYRSRLRNLDPYSAFASGSVFQSDQVVDNAITLEHLKYQPGEHALPPHEEWAVSLGIQLESIEAQQTEIPDWLAATAPFEESPHVSGIETPAELPAESRIPDWMRAAGWGEATGAAAEGFAEAETGEPSSIEPASVADIPDWLKAMAPAAILEPSSPAETTQPPTGEEAPDLEWLKSLEMSQYPQVASERSGETPAAVSAPVEEETPDWLQGMMAAGGIPAAEAAPVTDKETSETVPTPAEEMPNWLQEMMAEGGIPMTEAVPASAEEETPTWFQEIGENGIPLAETKPAAGAEEEAPEFMPGSAEETIPDWLQGLVNESHTQPTEPASPESEEISGRLKGLPAEGEEVMMEGEKAGEEEIKEEPSAPGAETIPAISSMEATPAMAEEGDNILDGSDALAWLEALAARQGARADELITRPESRPEEEMPEWVQRLAVESATPSERTEAPMQGKAAEPPVAEPVETLPSTEEALEGPALDEEEEPPLEIPQIFPEPPEPATVPIQESAGKGAPAWSREWLEAESGSATESVTEPAEELPEWLRDLAEEKPAEPVSAAEEEIPYWLRAEFAEEMETGRVTQPSAGEEVVVLPEERMVEEELTKPAESEARVEAEGARISAAGKEKLPAWFARKQQQESVEAAGEAEGKLPDWLAAEFDEETSMLSAAPAAEEPTWARREAAVETEAMTGAPVGEEEAILAEETPSGWAGKEAALETETIPATLPIDEEPFPPEEAISGWAGKEAALEAETTPATLPIDEEPFPPEEAISGWAGKEAALEADMTVEPSPASEEVEEPLAEMPQPTSPEEWVPEIVEEAEPMDRAGGKEATAPSPEPKIVSPSAPVSPARVRPAAGAPKDNEALLGAQTALHNGQLVEAMQEYGRLIRKGKFLKEIIHDLHEATYRYPVEVLLWQTLGDAYMRANQLQDALDAYTKAEELLR